MHDDLHEARDEGPSPEDLVRFSRETTVCPACGSEVYDEASVCPSCLRDLSDRSSPPGSMRVVVVVVVVIVILGLVLLRFW
ncbi:MAG: hypothetical protein ACF8GE_10575 [Phycisphaerales bacterium JB043]